MAARFQLRDLEDRKRALIVQSDQCRRELAAAIDELRPAAARLERGYQFVRSARILWPLITSAAGFLFVRKRRSLASAFAQGLSWWGIAKKVFTLWRGDRRKAKPLDHKEPVSNSPSL